MNLVPLYFRKDLAIRAVLKISAIFEGIFLCFMGKKLQIKESLYCSVRTQKMINIKGSKISILVFKVLGIYNFEEKEELLCYYSFRFFPPLNFLLLLRPSFQ